MNGIRRGVMVAVVTGSLLAGGPNEDPTHEAGESAAREAQENAGQVPTVP